MLQRADHAVQKRLAADKAMIRQQVGTISEMLAGPEADFEVKGAIIAEQSPGRDRPFLRHFDLREQLLKQLRLSRAELVPLTAAIKAVQCGRIGHQRPANPKRTESARGEWDFLDDKIGRAAWRERGCQYV